MELGSQHICYSATGLGMDMIRGEGVIRTGYYYEKVDEYQTKHPKMVSLLKKILWYDNIVIHCYAMNTRK